MTAPAEEPTVVRFEIAPRSIVWVVVTIAGVWLFLQLRVVALMLVVALVFAGTFNPLVEWMERRGLRRVWALTCLFVALLLVTALLIFLTVPPLVEQLARIVRDAPHHREQLVALLQQRELTAPLARAVQNARLEGAVASLESSLVDYSPRAARALALAMTTLVLSFYLLADGKRSQGVLYAIVPRSYHMRLARILQNLEVLVGGPQRACGAADGDPEEGQQAEGRKRFSGGEKSRGSNGRRIPRSRCRPRRRSSPFPRSSRAWAPRSGGARRRGGPHHAPAACRADSGSSPARSRGARPSPPRASDPSTAGRRRMRPPSRHR